MRFMAGDKLGLETDGPRQFLELDTSTGRATIYSLTRIVTPDGETCLVGTNTDITEMKRKEAEPAAKQVRYWALSEAVPVGIWERTRPLA